MTMIHEAHHIRCRRNDSRGSRGQKVSVLELKRTRRKSLGMPVLKILGLTVEKIFFSFGRFVAWATFDQKYESDGQ